MKIILFLILISLIVALGFLISFFWAVGSGQYDDDYTPSVRMLFEEKKKVTKTEAETEKPDNSIKEKDNNLINNSNTNKN